MVRPERNKIAQCGIHTSCANSVGEKIQIQIQIQIQINIFCFILYQVRFLAPVIQASITLWTRLVAKISMSKFWFKFANYPFMYYFNSTTACEDINKQVILLKLTIISKSLIQIIVNCALLQVHAQCWEKFLWTKHKL